MNNLLLRLPEDESSELNWIIWSKASGALQVLDSGSVPSVSHLQDLAEKASQCRVIAAVPGKLVTLRSLSFSGRLSSAVIKSLPYRLEEELNSDVDNLHVSVLKHDEDVLHLGLVEEQWMYRWSQWLETVNIQAKQWIPETLLIPWQPGTCSLLPFRKSCLVRYGQWQAASCDESWLSLFLEGIERESSTAEPLERVNLRCESHAQILTLMAESLTSLTANLLQGRWKPEAASLNRLRPWRLSVLLTILVMCSWTGLSLGKAWQINQAAEQLEQESRHIYQTLFPGERIIRLVPQINRKLQALQAAVEPDFSLLQQLNDLVPAFRQHPDIKLLMVRYDNNMQQLRITAEAKNLLSLTGIRDVIGISKQVSLESVEQDSDRIMGVIVIGGEKS